MSRRTLLVPLVALAALVAAPGAGALIQVVGEAAMTAQDLAASDVPVATPSGATAVVLPAQSTAPLPAVAAVVPGVYADGSCTAGPCWSGTDLPDASLATEGIPPQSWSVDGASVPRTCAPASVACLKPLEVPGSTVGPSPPVPGTGITLAPEALPPLCHAAPGACLGPVTYERQVIPLLGPMEPVPLTPEVGLSAALPEYQSSAGPHVLTLTPLDSQSLEAGPLGLTFCESGCYMPGASLPMSSSQTGWASVHAGGHRETLALPVLPSL